MKNDEIIGKGINFKLWKAAMELINMCKFTRIQVNKTLIKKFPYNYIHIMKERPSNKSDGAVSDKGFSNRHGCLQEKRYVQETQTYQEPILHVV